MDEENKPPPLDYRTADKWQTKQNRFIMGLVSGTIFSGVTWFVLFETRIFKDTLGDLLIAVIFVPFLKIGAAILLFRMPGWKGFGQGILLSLIVGCLIFFGICGAAIK